MKICPQHWDEVVRSLTARGMGHLLPQTPQDVMEHMRSGEPDPLMTANLVVIQSAVQRCGAGIVADPGCPVCILKDENILSFAVHAVAEQFASKMRPH